MRHLTLITVEEPAWQDAQARVMLRITHHYRTDHAALRALREALAEWGLTEDGRMASAETRFSFNWGDLAERIADGRFPVRHLPAGFESVEALPIDPAQQGVIVIDHNDTLLPD